MIISWYSRPESPRSRAILSDRSTKRGFLTAMLGSGASGGLRMPTVSLRRNSGPGNTITLEALRRHSSHGGKAGTRILLILEAKESVM